MSTIEEIDKIDGIGIDKVNPYVILKIFDHLDWDNEENHLHLLQEKINSYLTFIESGQIYDDYPYAKDKDIIISISFKNTPTANAINFLHEVSRILTKAGYRLEYEVSN